MNIDHEIDNLAEKIADILIARFEAKQQELAEIQAELLWNIPFKTRQDRIDEMKGKTGKQIMESE